MCANHHRAVGTHLRRKRVTKKSSDAWQLWAAGRIETGYRRRMGMCLQMRQQHNLTGAMQRRVDILKHKEWQSVD